MANIEKEQGLAKKSRHTNLLHDLIVEDFPLGFVVQLDGNQVALERAVPALNPAHLESKWFPNFSSRWYQEQIRFSWITTESERSRKVRINGSASILRLAKIQMALLKSDG